MDSSKYRSLHFPFLSFQINQEKVPDIVNCLFIERVLFDVIKITAVEAAKCYFYFILSEIQNSIYWYITFHKILFH